MTRERVKAGLALGALVLLPRALVFPVNENMYGDAIARTWLAHTWLQSPHIIGGFDGGGFQFGPLHLYLLALAEWLWPSLEHAGRLVSLVAGTLSAWPLFALTKRLAGQQAATWAVVVFAFWGLHIQCSTTSASEALNLLLVLGVLATFAAWMDEGRRVLLLATALLLNVACATRYDSWLLVPMLSVVAGLRQRSFVTMVWFGAASSAFAVPWMFGNWVDRGSPLFPFSYIDEFHRRWYPGEAATWGETKYRLMCLFFWPGTAVMTLTPFVALAGMVGLVRAWRAKTMRWLIVLVVLPAVLYTVRSTLLASFAPLARFTMKEVLLLLPFVWLGAQPVLARVNATLARGIVVISAAMLVAWCSWLGVFCFRTEGAWENTLRAIAPTSTNQRELMRVARWLGANAADPAKVLVVDQDPRQYDDMIVGFFAGRPYETEARRRSLIFETRLAQGPAGWLVRFESGRLEKDGDLVVDGATAVFRGQPFDEVPGFSPPIHVYRAR